MKPALLTFASVLGILLVKANIPKYPPFARTYGGLGDEVAYGVLSVPDDAYYVTGYTTSYGEGDKDVFLLKLDFKGNVIWMKTYGGEREDVALNIRKSHDGGMFLLGYTTSCDGTDQDGYIVKTDSSGNLEWAKVIGGDQRDMLTEVHERNNGELVCMLKSGSFLHNNGFFDYAIVVLGNNSAKSSISTYAMGEKYHEHASDLVALANDNLLFCGSMSSQGASNVGEVGGWLMVSDKNGKPLSNQSQIAYGVPQSSKYSRFHAIKKLSPNTNIVVGECEQLGTTDFDIILAKVNNQGDSIWMHRYLAPQKDWRPKLYVNGNDVAIAGSTHSNNQGNSDLLLMKLDSNGRLDWSKTYGSFLTEDAYHAENELIAPGLDDGYILVSGNSEFSKNGDLDIYIVKTGPSGEAPEGHVKDITLTTTSAPLSIQRSVNLSKKGSFSPHEASCGTENDVPHFTHNKSWKGDLPTLLIESAESNTEFTLQFHPNPLTLGSFVNLTTNHTLVRGEIYDGTGNLAMVIAQKGMTQLNCGHFTNGVYFVRAVSESGVSTVRKLIVFR